MDESVTEPPDELVAEEMQQNEIFAAMQKNPTSSGSSSTTLSGGMSAKIHLQDAIKKGRLTPMAKQRHEMHKTMLSLIERSSRSNNNDNDDELDLSFASLAMHIRRNFNLTQREAIHTEILNLVNTAIANKEKGMPIITPRLQGFHIQAANLPPQQAAQVQQTEVPAPPPPPPQMQPAPQMQLLNYSTVDETSYIDLLNSN